MGRKLGGGLCPLFVFWGAEFPTNSTSPGPMSSPISMPSLILIDPTVWPQYTNVTDRQTDRTGQRSDSIGRTVLQTVAQNQTERDATATRDAGVNFELYMSSQ